MKWVSFTARIEIIGINPYVYLPQEALEVLFAQSGKSKGKIPVRMTIDGHEFPQTLVKYAGDWRLYLNTPMRKAAGKDVGDTAGFEVCFDPEDRTLSPHPKFVEALKNDPGALRVFGSLRPSRQQEIIRYLSFLKSEEALERNIKRAIRFLNGEERFIGTDKP